MRFYKKNATQENPKLRTHQQKMFKTQISNLNETTHRHDVIMFHQETLHCASQFLRTTIANYSKIKTSVENNIVRLNR